MINVSYAIAAMNDSTVAVWIGLRHQNAVVSDMMTLAIPCTRYDVARATYS
jgi:hypothetical protein